MYFILNACVASQPSLYLALLSLKLQNFGMARIMAVNVLCTAHARLCSIIYHAPAKVAGFFSNLPYIPQRKIRPELHWSDIWIHFTRLVAISIITTGIGWGATSFRIFLKEKAISGFGVDADLQLAILGFFNKMLDVLLITSLEYTASILLTTWMTAEENTDARGATFGDFELKNELTKPWITIWSFVVRCRRFKCNWWSFLRFLLCLCVSVCVLLQGLATNTIAIPKQRWYPNLPGAVNGWSITKQSRGEMTIKHPKEYLHGVNWSMHLKAGLDNFGEEAASEWAFALSASRSMDGLSDVVPVCSLKEKGWQLVHGRDLGGTNRWTGLNTKFDAKAPVETLSVTNKQVWDVFDWLRKTGHGLTTASTGWTGNITLMAPVLNTDCEFSTKGKSISERSMTVTIPDDQYSSGVPDFTIDFGPIGVEDSKPIKCTISFRQALHSFEMWIVDMADVDLSQNHYYQKFDERLIYQPTSAQDYTITRVLAIQTQNVLPFMNRLMTGEGISQYLLSMSRKLQQTDLSIQSDAQGLSVVVATLIQNLISYSDQIRSGLPSELSSDPNDFIISYPIQWQIYGSGPRLAWEWVAVFILVVVLCSFCFGVWQTVWYWMAPGNWTDVSGMMVIAQESSPLHNINVEEKASKMLYFVDTERDGKPLLSNKECGRAR